MSGISLMLSIIGSLLLATMAAALVYLTAPKRYVVRNTRPMTRVPWSLYIERHLFGLWKVHEKAYFTSDEVVYLRDNCPGSADIHTTSRDYRWLYIQVQRSGGGSIYSVVAPTPTALIEIAVIAEARMSGKITSIPVPLAEGDPQ